MDGDKTGGRRLLASDVEPGARILVDGTWLGTLRNVSADGLTAYVTLDQGSAGTVEAARVALPVEGAGKSWPPDGLETKGAAR